MENHANKKFRGLLMGLASMMSTVFVLSPPFEKNPQQCEMVQTIGKKKQSLSGEPDGPDG